MDMSNDDDPKVGYGRPPVHTRWQKGQSGNPNGRPKKSKNLDTLMELELDKVIVVREAGKEKRLTKREAIARRLVHGALAGNARHLEFMFKYMAAQQVPDPFTVTDDDEAELERAVKALLNKEDDDEPG